MTDTLLSISCEASVNCTVLTQQPGATVVSPLLLSCTGVIGKKPTRGYGADSAAGATVVSPLLLSFTGVIGKKPTRGHGADSAAEGHGGLATAAQLHRGHKQPTRGILPNPFSDV